MMPINSVEKTGFRRMLSTFDSRYELRSRKYFSQTAIPTLYAKTRGSVTGDLKQTKYYSAMTDLWSSITMEPYMSFTIHYIDDQWKLQNRCLQTMYVPEDHTTVNLADALKGTLEAWDLDEQKLTCVTTDSGANIVSAANKLNWTRLSCFSHNLHLAVTNSIKDDQRVSRALEVCRKIVQTFSHSWKKRSDLPTSKWNLASHSIH